MYNANKNVTNTSSLILLIVQTNSPHRSHHRKLVHQPKFQTTAKTTERIGLQLADGKLQDIRKQEAFRKLMILLIPCLQLCKYASQ
jgi:hypothetical protein